MSENELEVYCKIVELRGLGNPYRVIALKSGLTVDQVGSKIGKLKHNFKNWSTKDNVLKRVCERLSMTAQEVNDAVNTKGKFIVFNDSKPLRVKIKDTISSPELWYHSYRGEGLEVVKRDGQYYNNTPAKLRIKHQDCVEV